MKIKMSKFNLYDMAYDKLYHYANLLVNDEEINEFKSYAMKDDFYISNHSIKKEIDIRITFNLSHYNKICEFQYKEENADYLIAYVNQIHFDAVKYNFISANLPIPDYKFKKRDLPKKYRLIILRITGV